ncbi:MAG: PAC2 family protein [Deltaproteobacteria bacterium]|jgi:proteasome assembly chaperone (PAC2) family protein|nr:PAC2 family protein [Deltaproteobacteria bacterium]
MISKGFQISELPELKTPILIAGFGGWGNALDISRGMAAYLIRKLEARLFASIDSDVFFRYDVLRPDVDIKDGALVRFDPPGGSIYAAHLDADPNDIVILEADEPNLQWNRFARELFSLCRELGIKTVISLGSMYDNVLHSDRIISGIASHEDALSRLKQKGVIPVSYQGPGAVHSTLQFEGVKQGFQCISLWCHCPYYLQNTKHYGLLSHLADVLSFLGEFELDIQDLELQWKGIEIQIEKIIENSSELQVMIDNIRKAKVRGTWQDLKRSTRGEKVIDLADFLPLR